MRTLLLILGLGLSSLMHAATFQPLATRFGSLSVEESQGPRFSLRHKGKTLLTAEALSVRQEGIFRFTGKDILVLRFHQGTNSHEDLIAFVGVDAGQNAVASELLRIPANVQVETNQREDTVRLDLGVDRFTHRTAVFDGQTLRYERKGISLNEKREEPLDEQDCSKLYNSLYLKAFGASQCQQVTPMIREAFAGNVSYGAMLKRSRLLNQDKLADQAARMCETRSVMLYNDFKSSICGYSTIDHPNPAKNYATNQ